MKFIDRMANGRNYKYDDDFLKDLNKKAVFASRSSDDFFLKNIAIKYLIMILASHR
jgi:hypothetical protein